MSTALLLIDLQQDVVAGKASSARQPAVDAAYDACAKRLAKVLYRARNSEAKIVVVQHDGSEGHRLETGSEGWELRPEFAALKSELVIHKQFSDAFFETTLGAYLSRLGILRLVIGGCMTQFCVDTTVRSAVARGYDVTLLSDGHTCGDQGALTFEQIIDHHNLTLDGFEAGMATVSLATCDEVEF